MTTDHEAASEPAPTPAYKPRLRQRLQDAGKIVATGTAAAYERAKTAVQSIGMPVVLPNDVLAEVYGYLGTHGIHNLASFDHASVAFAIARTIANDVEHVATKAVAGYSPGQQVLFIALAVIEVVEYIAAHGPTTGLAPVAVAGKIEPVADGPKDAA